MSFGFKDRVDCIADAISHAKRQKILMFVAASNEGGNGDIYFPAYMSEVICVNAFTGEGNPASFAPSPTKNQQDFAVLGTDVYSYWSHERGGGKRYMSGTSCAAPILAGIAAMILSYVLHLGSKHQEYPYLNRLRETENMQRMLHIITKNRSEYRYVQPWTLFGKNIPCDEKGEALFLQRISEQLK